jgi:DNA-binding transcriptional ArsR family regulator
MPVPGIHFTADDLARTRFAPGPDPDRETALSLDLLRSARPPGPLAPWRAWARRRLGRWVTPLLASAPAAEHDADDRIGRDEDPDLRCALERYRATVITPIWPGIARAVATDRARRTHTLLENGLGGLLDTLSPLIRWRAPVLTPGEPDGRIVSLTGRGLVLMPSYFCSGPLVLTEPDHGPMTLIHPIAPESRQLLLEDQPRNRRPRNLDALMGSTRAAVLQALGEGCTTKQLADRVGVSPASASQHATVLREAGLISTQRHGPAVLHIVTALGSAVLKPMPTPPDLRSPSPVGKI